MKKNNKINEGFTLIELLVVIAIISLLATIVMVSLNTARAKARDSRRVSDIRQLQLALQMYYDAAGSYPAALATLAPTYINAVPKDPNSSATNYQYCLSASSSIGYHLGTGVVLETDSIVLDSDADNTSDGCTTGTFSGADNIYDVIP